MMPGLILHDWKNQGMSIAFAISTSELLHKFLLPRKSDIGGDTFTFGSSTLYMKRQFLEISIERDRYTKNASSCFLISGSRSQKSGSWQLISKFDKVSSQKHGNTSGKR